jgi:hypothetical protein
VSYQATFSNSGENIIFLVLNQVDNSLDGSDEKSVV